MPSSGVSEDSYSVLIYNNKSIFGLQRVGLTGASRGPKFNSQQAHKGSQLYVQLQCAHIHKINKSKTTTTKPPIKIVNKQFEKNMQHQ